jgi:hypothetical protein
MVRSLWLSQQLLKPGYVLEGPVPNVRYGDPGIDVVFRRVYVSAVLWGLAGAFIGVPILIAFMVYCAQEPSSRWLAALLSAGTMVGTGHNHDLLDRSPH